MPVPLCIVGSVVNIFTSSAYFILSRSQYDGYTRRHNIYCEEKLKQLRLHYIMSIFFPILCGSLFILSFIQATERGQQILLTLIGNLFAIYQV